MTKADHIAIDVKFTISEFKNLGAVPTCVILGGPEFDAVINNPDPCSPPNYDKKTGLFCGLPLLLWSPASAPNEPFKSVGVRTILQAPAPKEMPVAPEQEYPREDEEA